MALLKFRRTGRFGGPTGTAGGLIRLPLVLSCAQHAFRPLLRFSQQTPDPQLVPWVGTEVIMWKQSNDGRAGVSTDNRTGQGRE